MVYAPTCVPARSWSGGLTRLVSKNPWASRSAPVRHHFAQGGGDGGLVILEPRDVAIPLRLVHVEQSIEMLLDGFPLRVTRTNFHARLPSFWFAFLRKARTRPDRLQRVKRRARSASRVQAGG